MFKPGTVMVNAGEMLPIVIYFRSNGVYFHSAATTEMRTVGGVRHEKVTSDKQWLQELQPAWMTSQSSQRVPAR